MTRIILASQSPRRREILQFFSLPFEQRAPKFNERSVEFDGDPKKYVETIAQKKAEEMGSEYADAYVITADTAVYFDKKIYGKPKDEKDAAAMLATLSGNWHEVHTAVCVHRFKKIYTGSQITKVLFNTLSDSQIRKYLHSMSYLDKAGSYTLQKSGSLLVKEISGCYYNVLGLPINTLEDLLRQADLDLWNFLGDR